MYMRASEMESQESIEVNTLVFLSYQGWNRMVRKQSAIANDYARTFYSSAASVAEKRPSSASRAEQLDVEPAKYFVRVIKRERRACKGCEKQGV
jgi:hypothetical protein